MAAPESRRKAADTGNTGKLPGESSAHTGGTDAA